MSTFSFLNIPDPMNKLHFLQSVGAFAAAFTAGAINSIAGGGTLISFPVLMALGLPSTVANATNTVGIWPGSLGSTWGFRAELKTIPPFYRWYLLPAFVGSALGAILLRLTPSEVFEKIAPWLILFATFIFMVQTPIRARLSQFTQLNKNGSTVSTVIAFILQTGVSIYGGYFGAGMSILMLTVLAINGLTDILEMSAMTSLLSLAINGTAATIFIYSHLVDWHFVIAMALGSVLGGYSAVGMARRVDKVTIRKFVVFVGIVMSFLMFFRLLFN